jgi:phage-related protein
MGKRANWEILFYTDARGINPVQEFIKKLAKPEKAKVIWVIDLLAEYGIHLSMPHSRPIGQDLWELRADAGRIFYFTNTGRQFILLHGYIKKSQRASAKEIDTARRRMREFKERV